MYERPSYTINSHISKAIGSPTNFDTSLASKPSGALTSRPNKQSTLTRNPSKSDKMSLDRNSNHSKHIDSKRHTRIGTGNKTRCKGRLETNKETSSSSSKISIKPPSSLSKSRTKDKISNPKHKKK